MTRTPNELPKYLYLEMLNLCRQYDRFRQIAKASIGHIEDIEIARNAEACLRLIDKAAVDASDKYIAPHLINNVCRNVPYINLYNVPCSQSTFALKRMEFMRRLAKSMHKI